MLAGVVARSRHECHVIGLTGPGPLSAQLSAVGVPCSSVNLQGVLGVPGGLASLATQARRFRPDVVVTWLYHADLFGGLVGRFVCRVPVVWTLHNTGLHSSGSHLGTRMVLRVLARFSRWLPSSIVTCASAAQAAHVDLGYPESKFCLIPNGVEVSDFGRTPDRRAAVRTALGLSDSDFVIVRVARWDAQKDFASLLRAFSIVAASSDAARLVLVGRGCDATNLQLDALIKQFGVGDRTVLLGARGDVPAILAGSDLAVSSSVNEAAPLALVEAMASGLPQVVTDVGDCASTVGAAGLVVPPSQPDALAEAIVRVMTDHGLAASLADAAKVRVRDFDIARSVDAYDRLVDATTEGRA